MTETTAALRRRIELAEELRSVTGTMKSLAAVTVHQYERSVHALHEYSRTVELGLQVLLRARPDLLPQPPAAADGPLLLIVFGSARGLCGPLNRHVAQRARAFVDYEVRVVTGEPCTVIASGTRAAMELEDVALRARRVVEAPGSAESIGYRVQDLLVLIDQWRRGESDGGRVVLVHPRPRSGRQQYAPVTVPLLPLDVERLRELADAAWPTRILPTWRDDWPSVFAALTRQLLFVDLHRAHAETEVCVHRARLAAMQGAEENIDERLEQLSMRYHRQRQAAITDELLDVVSGFEAAGGSKGRRRGG